MKIFDRCFIDLHFETLRHEKFNVNYINNESGWRFKTLFEKEPETIDWINSFRKEDVFWDIGANVGIYSIWAVELTL